MINDIITAMEKECAVAEFQFDKANMLFEMVEKNHEMMYQEASVMVYANDRSYDDLCALYEAADAETNEKKGGILSTIFNAIASIASAIGGAIKKFFDSIRGKTDDGDEIVKIAKKDKETIDLVDEYTNNSGKVLGTLSNLPFGKIIGAVAGASATIGIGSALYKHLTKPNVQGTEDQPQVGVKKSFLENGLNKIHGLISKIGPGSKKVAEAASGTDTSGSDVTPEQQNTAKENAGAMKTILEKLQSLISTLMNKIFGKKDSTSTIKGEGGSGTPTNTGDQTPNNTNSEGQKK